jgi:hypothetical protein
VQKTALNGAQIASLVELATAVADGTLSEDVAAIIIKISLPEISDEDITALIAALKAIAGQNEDKDNQQQKESTTNGTEETQAR